MAGSERERRRQVAQAKFNTKIWRAEELGSAELLRGRFADYAYDVHTHETACFALITRGAIRIRMRGTEFTAQTGDLYAIDADEPHAGWPVDAAGWSLRTLYVDTGTLRALVAADGRADRMPRLAGPVIRDPALAALLRGVHWCSEVGGPALKREARYLAFVRRLLARHTATPETVPEPGREARAVRLARAFLDQRLDQQVSLGEVAAAAGLPPFRLLRAFERATGMSPHRYQRQARIRLAAGLIRLGRPLGEAAAEAGFADQAHLTRSFRRTLGVTPGAYQRLYRPQR